MWVSTFAGFPKEVIYHRRPSRCGASVSTLIVAYLPKIFNSKGFAFPRLGWGFTYKEMWLEKNSNHCEICKGGKAKIFAPTCGT